MKKSKDEALSVYSILLFLFVALLLLCGYTYALQKMENTSFLESHLNENKIRADNMYTLTQSLLVVEDFTEINSSEDMNKEPYSSLQSHLNQMAKLNGTSRFYTLKKDASGNVIYVVDGSDLDSENFRTPGTLAEKNLVAFAKAAFEGDFVYSNKIIHIKYNHVYVACYPIRSSLTQEIVGVLCVEMDMQDVYDSINERNGVAMNAAMIGGFNLVILFACLGFYILKERDYRHQQNLLLQEAADAAKSSNRAKSVFLFNMSHDIRTPMNSIIGYIDLAKKHMDDPDHMQGYLNNIQNCGKKLLALLDSVLDLARIESDKTIIEQMALNVDELASSCVSMLYIQSEKKHQSIEFNSEVSHKFVYMDEVHVSEILINLLSNAVKYTQNDGDIRLCVRQKFTQKGWCIIHFDVIDNGIGMSEQFQKEIFEMFSRERTSTKSGVDGAGIGMSIVKRLTELMDGTIDVHSVLGQGSTFTVSIPCRLAREEDLQPKQAELTVDLSYLKGKRILLVEDNELNAEIATELLQEEGFIIEWANDGVVCLEKLQNNPDHYYDLILMDIQMPILNGFETTQKIRKMSNPILSKIPIIAMTANAFSEDKEASIKAGMNDHVSKPIDMNTLLNVICKYIS